MCVELQGVLVHAGVIDTVEMARRQEDMVRGMGLGGGVRDVTGRG